MPMTTNLSLRAWGLDSTTDRDWTCRAACLGQWRLFDAETYGAQCKAAHVCTHCPVIADCAKTIRGDHWLGVLGGMVSGWRVPQDPGCGEWCANARLAARP